MSANNIAYHFTSRALRDGRPLPPIGKWLIHRGPIVLCKSGLHASRHPFDALFYSPLDAIFLHRVEVDKIEEEVDEDKLVCGRRKILQTADVIPICREFTRQCAVATLSFWTAPDAVVDFLYYPNNTLGAARAAEKELKKWLQYSPDNITALTALTAIRTAIEIERPILRSNAWSPICLIREAIGSITFSTRDFDIRSSFSLIVDSILDYGTI